MRKLALAAVLAVAAAVPASAPAAGCSPLDCAPSQVSLAGGKLLAIRAFGAQGQVRVLDLRSGRTRWHLPGGILSGSTLVHQDGTLLTWFDASTGARLRDAILVPRGSFLLVGVSQDGRSAVLARTQRRSTTFAIVSPARQRIVKLGRNNWSFDALSGTNLYLLRYLRTGYQVRLYDLARDRLVPQPLKDPNESSLISGLPWERVSSTGGRYLFTLYTDSNGAAMIHELDLRAATARCIDLPGRGNWNSATAYSLALSPDGRTLWAVSTGYGTVAAIDGASARVRMTFHFPAKVNEFNGTGVAAISPDGRRIAVAAGGELWFVEPAQRTVVQGKPHVAIALGFSPDGRTLWAVGERSRVAALPLR